MSATTGSAPYAQKIKSPMDFSDYGKKKTQVDQSPWSKVTRSTSNSSGLSAAVGAESPEYVKSAGNTKSAGGSKQRSTTNSSKSASSGKSNSSGGASKSGTGISAQKSGSSAKSKTQTAAAKTSMATPKISMGKPAAPKNGNNKQRQSVGSAFAFAGKYDFDAINGGTFMPVSLWRKNEEDGDKRKPVFVPSSLRRKNTAEKYEPVFVPMSLRRKSAADDHKPVFVPSSLRQKNGTRENRTGDYTQIGMNDIAKNSERMFTPSSVEKRTRQYNQDKPEREGFISRTGFDTGGGFDSMPYKPSSMKNDRSPVPPETKFGSTFGRNGFSEKSLAAAKQAADEKKRNIFIPDTRLTSGDDATEEKIPGFGKWLGDNVMRGIREFNRGVANTVDFFLPTAGDFGGDSTVDRIIDYYKDDADRLQLQAEKTNDMKGGKWRTAGDTVSKTTAALPHAIIALMTGGSSESEQVLGALQSSGLGNTIISAAQRLMKKPTFLMSFLQVTGNIYEEAKLDGANEVEAIATAVITGLLDAGVEAAGGIDTLPGKKRLVRNWVRGALEEGNEEVIQGVIENEVKKIVYDRDKPVYSESGDAVINPRRAFDEFKNGATVGGILGAGQMGVGEALNSYRSLNNYMADNMTDEGVRRAKVRDMPKSDESIRRDAIRSLRGQTDGEGAESTAKELARKGYSIYNELPDNDDGYSDAVRTAAREAAMREQQEYIIESIFGNDMMQFYRPYEITDEAPLERTRKSIELKLYKVKNPMYDMYATKGVKLKPREQHKLNMNITKAYELLGKSEAENKPKICIVTGTEMRSTAVASYHTASNTMFINEDAIHSKDVSELQKQFTVSDNPVSTYLHELIHWNDAMEYTRRNPIKNQADYDMYDARLKEYCKRKLDRAQRKGYNIFVSKYAEDEYKEGNYEEPYTEYRVWQILKGGAK